MVKEMPEPTQKPVIANNHQRPFLRTIGVSPSAPQEWFRRFPMVPIPAVHIPYSTCEIDGPQATGDKMDSSRQHMGRRDKPAVMRDNCREDIRQYGSCDLHYRLLYALNECHAALALSSFY
jgi:hypothetical protein